jgi:hypothetical protein
MLSCANRSAPTASTVGRRYGSNLYEHLAGVNDLLLARATFAAAVKRWPGAKITLRNRNGVRIIKKTWPADD